MGPAPRPSALALVAIVLALGAGPTAAAGEQASDPGAAEAGLLDAGAFHTCALLDGGRVRCWGYSAEGELGYGNTNTVGVGQTPGSAGPVDLGAGRSAVAISAGDFHTCAILDDGSVRCWGYGAAGRLGYGNTSNVGDRQTPASAGPVDLGPGHTAKAISAGGAHTCAILDDGSVECWGYGGNGQLGYGNTRNVGDVQTPGSVGPVDLGPGRSAVAISAGAAHTCAILDNGSVECWGVGGYGRLGYGNGDSVGDKQTPGSVGPVDMGPGRTAVAISAGTLNTCAILDDGTVRCWGYAGLGQDGYANTNTLGGSPDTTPDKLGPVDLGPGRTARAITAGQIHTCALLDDGSVRCWGFGNNGRLGYGNTQTIGDIQTPASAGPVELGAGRTATAISAGRSHTCARLDDGGVLCWGAGAQGQLGYCGAADVGATSATVPGSVGPVDLSGAGRAGCTTSPAADPRLLEASRARDLRRCLAHAAHASRRLRRRAHGDCLRLYARTPGSVTGVSVRAISRTRIVLRFAVPGSDGVSPPAARGYLIEQSPRPSRRRGAVGPARALCRGRCRFDVTVVGTRVRLVITHLRPHTTYSYDVAALDNVSGRRGPATRPVEARTL